MTSIFRSFLVASGIFAVFTAVQPALHAQGFGGAFSSFFAEDEDDDNSPVDVSANVADIYLEKNIITLLGNVVVDKKGTKITCNKMEIFLKDKSEEPSDKEKAEKEKETKPEAKPAAVSAVKGRRGGYFVRTHDSVFFGFIFVIFLPKTHSDNLIELFNK